MRPTKIGFILVGLLFSIRSYGVTYSLSGPMDNKSLGYYSQKSHSGSVSVDFSVSRYFKLGLSHAQQVAIQTGHKTDEEQTEFAAYESASKTTSNSLNITLTPFNGRVSPFVFAGVGLYHVARYERIVDEVNRQDDIFPGPQGGAGLGIRINRNFGVRLTHTLSLGALKTPDNSAGKTQVNDTTRIGINFRP